MSFVSSDSMATRFTVVLLVCLSVLGWECGNSVAARFVARTIEHESDPEAPVPNKVSEPIVPDVGLSVLWVGHACVLIQIHDKVFLTDPSFSRSVGLLSNRVVEPGIDPFSLHRIDYVLVSHIHFDHLNYTSLGQIPKTGKLLIPDGAARYTPEFGFRETCALKPWEVFEEGGVRITAVPARHFSGRYGFDMLWMGNRGYAGYVIQYAGKTVYFAGDTGYRDSLFTNIGQMFSIDLALIPIAPIEPKEMMSRVHLDPERAVQAFEELGAKIMIPIHHRTFYQGLEPRITTAEELLLNVVNERGLQKRIFVMRIGEQKILDP